MRTPIDLDLEDAGTPTEDAARGAADGTPRPPLVGPPNGKAWERLLLFEQERGLVEPDAEPPDTLTEAVRALDDDPMQTRSDRTVDYAEALEATELETDRARGAADRSSLCAFTWGIGACGGMQGQWGCRCDAHIEGRARPCARRTRVAGRAGS